MASSLTTALQRSTQLVNNRLAAEHAGNSSLVDDEDPSGKEKIAGALKSRRLPCNYSDKLPKHNEEQIQIAYPSHVSDSALSGELANKQAVIQRSEEAFGKPEIESKLTIAKELPSENGVMGTMSNFLKRFFS